MVFRKQTESLQLFVVYLRRHQTVQEFKNKTKKKELNKQVDSIFRENVLSYC